MRFMMMVKSQEGLGPPPKELMDAMDILVKEATKSGVMISGGGLAPTAMSKRVCLSGGRITVVDGPFTEVKEVIGGYAVMEFTSHAEALQSAVEFMELHKKYWPGWEGVSEIRQIFGPEDMPPKS